MRSRRGGPEPRAALKHAECRPRSRTHRHIAAPDGAARAAPTPHPAGEPRPYQGRGRGDTGPSSARREGREGVWETEPTERWLRPLVPAGEGKMSPLCPSAVCARRHTVPLRAPPKMSPRVHVLALPNLLVLPDPGLGLRAAAIGWQRGAARCDWCVRRGPAPAMPSRLRCGRCRAGRGDGGGVAASGRRGATMIIESVDALKSWLAKLLEPM